MVNLGICRKTLFCTASHAICRYGEHILEMQIFRPLLDGHTFPDLEAQLPRYDIEGGI